MMVFMLYCVLTTGLIAVACHFGEKCLAALGRPSRFAWLTGVALATLVAGAAIGRRNPDSAALSAHPVNDALVPVTFSTAALTPAITASISFFESVTEAVKPLDLALWWLWALGSGVSLLAVIVLAYRARRVAKLASPSVIAGARVRVTQGVGPSLLGIINYEIVVPEWALGLPEDQKALIIAHEQEHAEALDPLLVWLAAIAVTAFPWNPSIWFLSRRLRASIEVDCDRRVLAKTSDVHAYGSLLLDVGARISSSPFFAAALSESTSQLHRRIRAMTSARQPIGRLTIVSSTAAAILVLGAAYRTPRPEPPAPWSIRAIGARESGLASPVNQGQSVAKESIAMVAIESRSQRPVDVIVYGTKAARVATGALALGKRADTLRLRTPATITADLTGGDVHIVSIDGSLLEITAIFRDSPAVKAQSRLSHAVLNEGGSGVSGVFPPSDRAAGQTYFEFQVEKPVAQIAGTGAPKYPAALRASQVEGEVQAQFVVDETGRPEVGTFKILKATNDLFASAVRSAFPEMRFSPAEVRERKVRQIVHQSFQFRLAR